MIRTGSLKIKSLTKKILIQCQILTLAARRKAKKQEKKEKKRIAKQEQREKEAFLRREVQLAEAVRKWRETKIPPDYEEFPELDPHSEVAEVYQVSDEETDGQRQSVEDETEYEPNLERPMGDVFSDKSSSEETGDEKADEKNGLLENPRVQRKPGKLKRELKLTKKRRLNVPPRQDCNHSKDQNRKESEEKLGDHPMIRDSRDRIIHHKSQDFCSDKNPQNEQHKGHTHKRPVYLPTHRQNVVGTCLHFKGS